MGTGSTLVVVADGGSELRPSRCGSLNKELVESQLSLKYVALGETELLLALPWRQNLPMKNQVFDVGRKLAEGVDDGIAEVLALVFPVASFEFVAGVLDEQRQHVLARRSHRGVAHRGHHRVALDLAVAPIDFIRV